MKLLAASVLTISLSLFQATIAFGQAQDSQNSPQVAGSKPSSQPTQNQDPTANFSWLFTGSPDQPGTDHLTRFLTPHYQTYRGGWSIDDIRSSGITLAAADDSLRAHLKLPGNQGVVVTGLDPHSSAGQSGIQLNDVLLTLGELPLTKPEDLEKHLKSFGEKPVTLHLLRAGKETKLQVQPLIQVTFRSVRATKLAEKPYWIGISLSPLDPALRAQLQLPDRQGLIVHEVVKDSPASRAEIKVNDILFEIDGKPMADSAKLAEVVQSHTDKAMVLHFIREGKKHWSVEVTPERRKVAEVNSPAEHLYRTFAVTRPGAVVTDTIKPGPTPSSNFLFYDRLNDTITMTPNKATDPKQATDAAGGVSKRLDSLDADIKQLRQAIEELSRATKEKK